MYIIIPVIYISNDIPFYQLLLHNYPHPIRPCSLNSMLDLMKGLNCKELVKHCIMALF